MKRKLLFVLCVLCLAIPVMAQKTKAKRGPRTGGSFGSKLDRKHAKYFVSMGAGMGTSWWNSSLGNTEVYDQNGGVISSGDLRFKAKNKLDQYYLDVSFPISRIRFGIGINFEYNYLDKLKVLRSTGDQYILYIESFRFDKFYLLGEFPFNPESDSPWGLSAKMHMGWYGLSYVDHFNFFGEEALAKTYFVTLGGLVDYKLYPHTYLFLFPNFEFKYFDNSKEENPADIHHKILTGTITAGIRIDVSKE